jgi:hypothetical protein
MYNKISEMNKEFKRMQMLAGLITESKQTIELYTGVKLTGPSETKAQALELKKEIETAMKNAFKAAKGSGSESAAMDERDDTVYEFKDKLKKINWDIN